MRKYICLLLLFSISTGFPLVSSAQENTRNEKVKPKKRVFIFDDGELESFSEDVKEEFRQARKEIKKAMKELEKIDWEDVEVEIESALEEARVELEEARSEMRRLEVEIEEEVEGMEDYPRVYVRTDNYMSRPDRKVERNFSSLEITSNEKLKEAYKKDATETFDNQTQQSLELKAQEKEGMFELSFELPQKADTNIEVYDSNENLIYYESLSNFSGKYNEKIDLAVNGADVYTLVVRQGKKYLSRTITLK